MRNGRRGRRVKGFVNQQAAQKIRKRAKTWKLMKKNWLLYMFLLPAALYIAIFHYGPMYGLQIAFRDYKAVNGIWGSKWVGLKWITTFMNTPRFWMIFKNTLKISLYSLISFPFPIILAVFLNNVRNVRRKKFVQTVTYMPHFISTVVLVGKGKDLAKDLGTEVTAVLIGSQVKGLCTELAEYGADRIIVVDDPELKEYRTEPYAHALAEVIRKYKPEIMLIGATAIGRARAPSLAAKRSPPSSQGLT